MEWSLLVKMLFYHNFPIVLKHERFVYIYYAHNFDNVNCQLVMLFFFKGYIQSLCRKFMLMVKEPKTGSNDFSQIIKLL